MARKPLTTLKDQCTTSLPDNNVGAITPANVRTMIRDFLDTMTPGYGTAQITTPVAGYAVAATSQDFTEWQSIPVATGEFTVDLPTGTITVNVDCVLDFTANLTFEGNQNEELEMTSLFSGAGTPGTYRDSAQARGTGRPVSVTVSGLFDCVVGDTLKMQVRSVDGASSFTINSGVWIVRLVPLINAPTP